MGAAPPAATMPTAAAQPGPTSGQIAQAWLAAVADRDLERLGGLLAEDVWTRVLLPREVVETDTDLAVLAAFHEWFITPAAVEPLDVEHHTLAGREHVRYRFRLRPRWAPDTWHLIEQSGYLRVADGRVRRIDLVCTGFHPVA